MKKIVFILGFLMLGMSCLRANPIPFPSVRINEILFDAEKGWMLEIVYYSSPQYPFTRVVFKSSSEEVELKHIPVWEDPDLYYKCTVYTKDSMQSSLKINPLGDVISVKIFFENEDYPGESPYEDVLIFGNYTGAKVGAPKEGQSIMYMRDIEYLYNDVYYYCKTSIPTLGNLNSPVPGFLKGKIYDKNENPVTLGGFSFSHDYYDYSEIIDGEYQFSLLAQPLQRDYIYYNNGKKLAIRPINVEIEPDETLELDIHLLDDYMGIDAPESSDYSPILIFPNPAASGQAIHYEINLPVKSMNCRLEIFAIDGRLIHQEKVAENNGAVNLPNALPAGVYLVHFKINNKISHTTRMIIN